MLSEDEQAYIEHEERMARCEQRLKERRSRPYDPQVGERDEEAEAARCPQERRR